MTRSPHLQALLGLLTAVDDSTSSAAAMTRSGTATTDADSIHEEVVETVRTSTEAQLALYQLAWEMNVDDADTEAELCASLQDVAARVEAATGVDVFETVLEERDRLPAHQVPECLVSGTA